MPNPAAILVAEDDSNDALLLQLAFGNAGFDNQIAFVRNGAEALVYLKGDGRYTDRTRFPLPHLLLLDLKMQPVSGFEVLAWVRQQPRFHSLPIVMFSASNFPPDIDRAYQLGANSFLLKPGNFGELVNSLKQLATFWLTQCQLPSRPPVLPVGVPAPTQPAL
jgi:CheY-like chemotaxis protein